MHTSIQASVISNTGLIRINNEDNFFINGIYMEEKDREKGVDKFLMDTKPHHLIAVFDGMGGEEHGELASITAAKMLSYMEKEFAQAADSSWDDRFEKIRTYVKDTNNAICKAIEENGRVRMGATVAGLYIYNNRGVIFHLGDSRVYRFRNGELQQLTKDHTEAQRLIKLGVLDEEGAKKHRSKHQLTRHLGVLPQEGIVEADVSEEFQIKKGDVFLLCSDGLTDMISDSYIKEVIDKYENMDEANKNLVTQALKKGGHDNITSLLIKVDELEDEKQQDHQSGIMRSIHNKLNRFSKFCRGED